MSDITPGQLAALQLQAETGMTAAELLALSTDEYARLTGRPTMGQIASQATGPPDTPRQAPAPAPTQAGTPESEPNPGAPGIDVQGMTMEQYAAMRGQLGVGRSQEYGKGIMSGGGTSDWIAAAQRKSGRSGMNERNLVQSPRIERAFLDPDERRDTRTVAERFSDASTWYTPGR